MNCMIKKAPSIKLSIVSIFLVFMVFFLVFFYCIDLEKLYFIDMRLPFNSIFKFLVHTFKVIFKFLNFYDVVLILCRAQAY